MSWGDWAGAVQNVVQAIALVIVGMWAYYKFVRGRTFAYRAELEVTGELVSVAKARGMRASVSLENAGASDIPLRVGAVRLYALPAHGDAEDVDWQQVGRSVRIFSEHGWVEAQETIRDEVALRLPTTGDQVGVLAYRVDAVVYERRKDARGGIRWTARVVVPNELD